MRTPAKARRPKRTRKGEPEAKGVSAAQKLLAALLDKHDPPPAKAKH